MWSAAMASAIQTFRSKLPRLQFLGLLMLGAYLLINLILLALAPLTAGWSLWAVTAIAVPLMVIGMVYGIIPFARRATQG
jgi:hypothetical protein